MLKDFIGPFSVEAFLGFDEVLGKGFIELFEILVPELPFLDFEVYGYLLQ